MTRIDSGEFRGTDRFEIRRILGQGGMGVVYAAFDRQLGTSVALKALRRLDPESIYRLKKEFRSLHGLEHRNLVSLGELLESRGQWFFTMELVEGTDFLSHVRPTAKSAPTRTELTETLPLALAQRAEKTTSPAAASEICDQPQLFDEERLRDAFGQLALGLDALHSTGRVHRDVKPTNILVTREHRVVLLDFGLMKAAAAEEGSTEQNVVGTVAYMAPEQASCITVGPEADWYAAGVMLYEALTGSLPFSGSPYEVLSAKQHCEPTPPKERNPEIPRDLDELCVSLLRFSPKERPTAQGVLGRLGIVARSETPAVASSSVAQAPPFVGRNDELAELREALESFRSGNTVTVYLHGESGVGKSALLRRFVEEVQSRESETLFLRGRCYERESVPYKAFDGVIDDLSRSMRRLPSIEAIAMLPRDATLLPRVFPVLGRVEAFALAPLPTVRVHDPHHLRRRVFVALREFFFKIGERRLLIVGIDDLQWADPDSMLLLSYLLREPDAPPLLLLLSSRNAPDDLPHDRDTPSREDGDTSRDEREREAQRLLRRYLLTEAGDVRDIEVRTLNPDDACHLARLLLERAAGDRSISPSSLAVEAQGHPMFIDELVRHSEAVREHNAKLRLDEAIWARVEELPAPAKNILTLVAVAGAPLSRETLCRAARMEPSLFARHVSVLRVGNLVVGLGSRETDSIEPYHDRVRDAVVAHLDESTLLDRHTRLAIALETGADARERPELLLRHLEAAGQTEKASHYALSAARMAVDALAFDRAAELFRSAIRLGTHPPDRARTLWESLGEALANAGRGSDAAAAYEEAARAASGSDELRLRRLASEQHLHCGEIDEGVDGFYAVARAIGIAAPETPGGALRSFVVRRAWLRLRGYRYRVRDKSQVSPDEIERLDLCQSASISFAMFDPIIGADFQTRLMLMALRAGEPRHIAGAFTTEAGYAATSGTRGARRSRKLLDRARAIAESKGQERVRHFVWFGEAVVAYLLGRWDESRSAAERALDELHDRSSGVDWELENVQLYHLWALYYLGRLRELAERVPDLLRDARARGDLFMEANLCTGLPNTVWLLRGDAGAARAAAKEAMTPWTKRGFQLIHYREVVALANAALYDGEGGGALELVLDSWQELRSSLLPRVLVIRLESLALRAKCELAAALAGCGDRDALLRAAERHAGQVVRSGESWAVPLGYAVQASVAGARGEKDRARRLYEEAACGFDDHSMKAHAAGARRQLGRLVEGDEGAQLVNSADEFFSEQGALAPDRIAAVFTP